ncbi:MAG: nucleotide sugar dehydrogenase, partial [SAR202 cluster bacterium]|nr:nucleotide sugar dehydrogenase [SAR202 cluster bacterium]
DAIIVCVPTPLSKTREPDISYIVSATDEIAKRLRPGTLVVLESTTYPGTTEEVILPRLQVAGGQTLTVGEDFFLAFSPERIDPGRTDWTVRNTPKVVGGVTAACTQAAGALYGSVVDQVVPVSTSRVAEMVKLLENTFRATNIALVNETTLMCERLDIDVWEVIDAAKTKPFGFMPFYPGPGLGGHCIPVDPRYLAWKLKTLDYDARFIRLADEINLAMPMYWVNRVQDKLNQNAKPLNGSAVLVLGVTYKRDVDDTRESPALDIIEGLLNRGAQVTYHDPYARTLEADAYRLSSIGDSRLDDALRRADCVVIVTDHSNYDWEKVRDLASVVIDTRNALGKEKTLAPSITEP